MSKKQEKLKTNHEPEAILSPQKRSRFGVFVHFDRQQNLFSCRLCTADDGKKTVLGSEPREWRNHLVRKCKGYSALTSEEDHSHQQSLDTMSSEECNSGTLLAGTKKSGIPMMMYPERRGPADAAAVGRVRPALPARDQVNRAPTLRPHLQDNNVPTILLDEDDEPPRLRQRQNYNLPPPPTREVQPTTPPGLKPESTSAWTYNNAGSNSPIFIIHAGANMAGANICLSPGGLSPSKPQITAKEVEQQGPSAGAVHAAPARTLQGHEVGGRGAPDQGEIDKGGIVCLVVTIKDVADLKETLDAIVVKTKKAESEYGMDGSMLGVWRVANSNQVIIKFLDFEVAELACIYLKMKNDIKNKAIKSVNVTNAILPQGAVQLFTPFEDSNHALVP